MAKREVKFESQDRRIAQINKVLNSYGIASIEEAEAICDAKGIDPYLECEQTQNICFENAKWAYVVGAAIAIKIVSMRPMLPKLSAKACRLSVFPDR
jgi:hypothetical protein